MIDQRAVEIAGAAAMQRITTNFDLGLAQRVEMDEFFEALQIILAQIYFFGGDAGREASQRADVGNGPFLAIILPRGLRCLW